MEPSDGVQWYACWEVGFSRTQQLGWFEKQLEKIQQGKFMCMCRSARHFDRFAFLNFLHCLQALLLTNPCTVIKRGLMRSHLVQAEVVRPTGQITFETNFIRSQRCTRSLLERSKTSMQTSSRESVCIEDCKSIAYHDRRFVFQWWLVCCYLPLYTCMIMYLFIYLFSFGQSKTTIPEVFW